MPVAGFGTRTLPASKSIPKEILPILDRPLIDYAVAEAWEAGIERIIMVTGRGKTALEDYFDRHPELEAKLGQQQSRERLNRLYPAGSIAFVRQQQALGLGHAVWCGREFLHQDEAFAVLLPDDFILQPHGGAGCLAQLVSSYQQQGGGNHLAVMEIEESRVNQFGIIEPLPPQQPGQALSIKSMVEKPTLDQAPSRLAIIGRYILEPAVLTALTHQTQDSRGEIQLTDAMAVRLAKGDRYYGVEFKGDRYDCGHLAGWLAANLGLAQTRPELAPLLANFISKP